MLRIFQGYKTLEVFYNEKSDLFGNKSDFSILVFAIKKHDACLIKGRFNIYPRFQEDIKNKTVFVFAEFPVGIGHLT